MTFQELESQLKQHDYNYWILNQPTITDPEYDLLYQNYINLCNDNNIPDDERYTTNLMDTHIDGFTRVKHKSPMLSLNKAFTLDELTNFYNKYKTQLNLKTMGLVVEPKIDGISVSFLYNHGTFIKAVSRGNGKEGDTITNQVKATGCIPIKLNDGYNTGTLEVRGEIYLPKKAFDELNQDNEIKKANPRNACAGLMRQKNIENIKNKGINCYIYEIRMNHDIEVPDTQYSRLRWLQKAGFNVSGYSFLIKTGIDDAYEKCQFFQQKRKDLDFEIDGVVIKINNIKHYQLLGLTSHHPKWAIAYKFPPDQLSTVINNITIDVGKTGKITPVAILEPIQLAGTMVSKASLHNFEEIERKDIRINDHVIIEKGGDIIPKVVSVLIDKRPKNSVKYQIPDKCPDCDTILLKDKALHYCQNILCPRQLRNKLVHFSSRDAMNIKGLGEALVDLLITKLGIKSPVDIYSITKEQLLTLPRIGEKTANNLLNAIHNSKDHNFADVLYSLTLKLVGRKLADDLADNFTYQELIDISDQFKTDKKNEAIKKLIKIDGIAHHTANVVLTQLSCDRIRNLLNDLKNIGIKFDKIEPNNNIIVDKSDGFFKDKICVISGTFKKYKRPELTKIIKELGGKITGSVSSKTDYLIVGENPGSKMDKAEQLNVEIIEEDDLYNLI